MDIKKHFSIIFIFGSIRSSRNANLCTFVCSMKVFLELSIFIFPLRWVSGQSQVSLSSVSGQSQDSLRSVSGQSKVSHRSVSGQSQVSVSPVSGQLQVSLRPVRGESQASLRSVRGESQAMAMNALWVQSADNEPPARACTAFECTGSYIS